MRRLNSSLASGSQRDGGWKAMCGSWSMARPSRSHRIRWELTRGSSRSTAPRAAEGQQGATPCSQTSGSVDRSVCACRSSTNRPCRASSSSQVPDLRDPPIVQHVNMVRVPDCGQPVGDDHGRDLAIQRTHRLQDLTLVDGIKRAGGLVEHQNVLIRQQCARERQSLALSAYSPIPRSPTVVASPSGRDRTKSAAAARESACHI